MPWEALTFVLLTIFGYVSLVLKVGEPRAPITAQDVVFSFIANLVVVWLVLRLAGVM